MKAISHRESTSVLHSRGWNLRSKNAAYHNITSVHDAAALVDSLRNRIVPHAFETRFWDRPRLVR
jgi:hypothetical protein